MGKLLTISAVDVDGIDATVFEKVELRYNGNPVTSKKRFRIKLEDQNKFKFQVTNDMLLPDDDQKENGNKSESGLVAEVSFMGNFHEPNCCIPLNLEHSKSNEVENEEEIKENDQNGDDENDNEFVCRLSMDTHSKQWSIESYEFPTEDEDIIDDAESCPVSQTTTSTAIATTSTTTSTTNDNVNTNPDDDELWNRVSQVLGDFENMKSDFQSMIDTLGRQIQREHGIYPLPVAKQPMDCEESKENDEPKEDEEPKEAEELAPQGAHSSGFQPFKIHKRPRDDVDDD